jgi:hypothetical protein
MLIDTQARRRGTFWAGATAAAMLFAAAPTMLYAQEGETTIVIDGAGQLPPEMVAKLQDMANQIARSTKAAITTHTARITPGLISVNAAKGTATFEITNPSNDTLHVALSAGVEPRVKVEEADFSNLPPEAAAMIARVDGEKGSAKKSSAKKSGGNPLLADDDSAASGGKSDSTKSDSLQAIDAKYSLAAWIKELPAKVSIAPHAKKSVTIKVAKPAGVAPGKYAAWIVAVTELEDPSKLIGGIAAQAVGGGAEVQVQQQVSFPKNALQSSAKLELLVN